MCSILFIDDEVGMQRVCSEILRSAGHDVQCASDGAEGLSLLRGTMVDLVITDILMPVKEGLETIIGIKRTYPGLRIVAISGGGSALTAGDCLDLAGRLGANAILQKPFRGDELLAAVDLALANPPKC